MTTTYAIDRNPERTHTALATATPADEDGKVEVLIAQYRPGVDWVVDALADLGAGTVLIDGRNNATALIDRITAADMRVEVVTAAEATTALGVFYDLVAEKRLVHHDQPELTAAVAGAARKAAGDGWTISRKGSAVDICPLVAAYLAVWAATQTPAPDPVPWFGIAWGSGDGSKPDIHIIGGDQ